MKAMKSESKEVLLVVLQKKESLLLWWLPKGVTLGGRSRLVRRSQIDTTRAASGCRCGEVALGAGATSPCRSRRSLRSVDGERVHGVAPVGRSHALLV
ncbi:hypothetical protein F2Q69_00020384 [Brassica cretica]|uniref:Uncharacterized protein n=1 Tax=Brassica cretica TaxID=69181 RepID=A0A8S9Q404_BRACR|nr:hypothetical protein F2Q69_00020384 [Brassica cretica]